MKHNFSGKLIVIEGIDGTGKSTQTRLLADMLKSQNKQVLQSFEPTNGQWGSQLRASATTGRLCIQDELDLFYKDRKEHVETVILPALEKGDFVILDRYYFSNMAYQGSRGISPEEIRKNNEAFAPEPDLLLILDLDVNTALERIGVRDGEANEFEQRDSLQFCKDLFLRLKGEPFAKLINANKNIDAVRKEIEQKVESFFI